MWREYGIPRKGIKTPRFYPNRNTDLLICGKQVDRYNALLDDLTKVIAEIHHNFTAVDAPKQLSLAHTVMKQINADVKATTQTTLPALELMFADSQEHIENVLAADIYPRFVKHQMTMSAVRALSADRGKYAGLGDCFCITDPK